MKNDIPHINDRQCLLVDTVHMYIISKHNPMGNQPPLWNSSSIIIYYVGQTRLQ